eukprot:scaffold13524_cov109-Isochrysis_galbana.AAC.14
MPETTRPWASHIQHSQFQGSGGRGEEAQLGQASGAGSPGRPGRLILQRNSGSILRHRLIGVPHRRLKIDERATREAKEPCRQVSARELVHVQERLLVKAPCRRTALVIDDLQRRAQQSPPPLQPEKSFR